MVKRFLSMVVALLLPFLLFSSPAHAVGHIVSGTTPITGSTDRAFTYRTYNTDGTLNSSFDCTMTQSDYNSYFTSSGQVVGTSDIDANNNTHHLVSWRPNSLDFWSVGNYGIPGCSFSHVNSIPVDTGYRAAAVNDMDNDGVADDVVFRNKSSDANTVWFLNGTSYGSYATLPSAGGTNWDIATVYDADNNGYGNIVWYDPSNQTQTVWYTTCQTSPNSNCTYSSFAYLDNRPSGQIASGGVDWDNDGDEDLVYLAPGSAYQTPVYWQMAGTSKNSVTVDNFTISTGGFGDEAVNASVNN